MYLVPEVLFKSHKGVSNNGINIKEKYCSKYDLLKMQNLNAQSQGTWTHNKKQTRFLVLIHFFQAPHFARGLIEISQQIAVHSVITILQSHGFCTDSKDFMVRHFLV